MLLFMAMKVQKSPLNLVAKLDSVFRMVANYFNLEKGKNKGSSMGDGLSDSSKDESPP